MKNNYDCYYFLLLFSLIKGNFPTPIHVLEGSKFQEYSLLRILHQVNITMVIKRDDMSGGPEMGGNKIRKLEFLLADALAKKCDAVVTIGGEQSNHCRATACAARLVGLEPHLILRRTKKTIPVKSAAIVQEEEEDETLGLTGNILYNRIVGSTIHTCTSGEVCGLKKKKKRKMLQPFDLQTLTSCFHTLSVLPTLFSLF